MSEQRIECDRFDEWIGAGIGAEGPAPHDHFEECPDCRDQWHTHQMLAVTFAEEAVPELSAMFEAGLRGQLASAVEVRPLRGWRRAAMLAYAAAALGFLVWALRDIPLPSIDPSAPWVVVASFVAVPLTFMLAIAGSRLIPGPGPRRGLRMLTL